MRSFEVIVKSRGEIDHPGKVTRQARTLSRATRWSSTSTGRAVVFVRPRNASPSAVFENAPKRKAAPGGDDGR